MLWFELKCTDTSFKLRIRLQGARKSSLYLESNLAYKHKIIILVVFL